MFKEEFGFSLDEIKYMLLKSPIIWKKAANREGMIRQSLTQKQISHSHT